MNFGVFQTSFLGDCVLTLPLIYRCLGISENSRVCIVATGSGFELFQIAKERGLRPYADRIDILNLDKRSKNSIKEMTRFLKEHQELGQKMNFLFQVQRSFRSSIMGRLWAPKAERVGFSSGAATFFYTKLVVREWNSGRHEIEKNLDLLRSLDPENNEVEKNKSWIYADSPSLLKNQSIKIEKDLRVCFSIGSPWGTKRWPREHFASLARELIKNGIAVTLLGDNTCVEDGKWIEKSAQSLLLQNLCGQTDLKQLLHQIEASDYVVSGDSAAVHIASDLKVPVIALFGPTSIDFGFAPWRRNSLALGAQNLKCRPCDIHGPKKCPLDHHKCMKDLLPSKVLSPILADLMN